MARKEFSGAGKIFANGTLVADATTISVSIGGQTNRVITTGGNTGETTSDPTMAKVSVSGAIAKRDSDYRRIRAYHRRKGDVTWRVEVGSDKETIVGKVSSMKLDGGVGKGEFSFEIEGDAQE